MSPSIPQHIPFIIPFVFPDIIPNNDALLNIKWKFKIKVRMSNYSNMLSSFSSVVVFYFWFFTLDCV